MRRISALLGALTIVGLGTSPAMAENRAGAFNIAPVIGGYHFDGEQKLDQDVLLGLKAGYNITDRFGIESLFHYMNPELHDGTADKNVDVYNIRLEALYNLFPKSAFVPNIAVGYGAITNVTENSGQAGIFSYGIGAKYFTREDVALRFDLRHLIIDRGPTFYNYEYTFGINFQFGGKATTAAAIVSPTPIAAESRTKPEPVTAPPDKITPAALPAPTTTLKANPETIQQGSSSTLSWSAQNSTGCNLLPDIGPVTTAGSRLVTPTKDTTYNLTCQGSGGEGSSSATVRVTAPVAKDSDNDGVIDANDKCPDTPAGVKVDKDGCPVQECRKDFPSIEFDFDKSVIKPEFQDNLRSVAAQMKKMPKSSVLFEGHTDSTGPENYNSKLSLRRATAASKFIVSKEGINADQIKIKSYGELNPVDTNKTKEGRRHNRRVEIKFTCPE